MTTIWHLRIGHDVAMMWSYIYDHTIMTLQKNSIFPYDQLYEPETHIFSPRMTNNLVEWPPYDQYAVTDMTNSWFDHNMTNSFLEHAYDQRYGQKI